MDLINREKAIEYLENHKKYAKENHIILAANEDAIINFLKTKCEKVDAEPVRHGKWIPCSEKLPDNDGEYIVTQKIYSLSNGKIIRTETDTAEFYKGKWRRAKHYDVTAWMPFPSPYEDD